MSLLITTSNCLFTSKSCFVSSGNEESSDFTSCGDSGLKHEYQIATLFKSSKIPILFPCCLVPDRYHKNTKIFVLLSLFLVKPPAAQHLLHLLLEVAGHVAEGVEHLHLLLLGIIIILLILILMVVDVKLSAAGLYTDLQGVNFKVVTFTSTIPSLRK